MSFQTIIETAFSQKVMTIEMEERLKSMLFSHDFSFQEMVDLEALTEQLESGEIKTVMA